jgi:tRNA (guanine37-N1)-methyltransferase
MFAGLLMSRGKFLKKIAAEVLGEDIAKKLWGRLEIIGDIAILRKPPDVELEVLRPLAEEIIRRLPYVRSVWAAITPVVGEYRIREFAYLAGEKRSTTIYKEHGCVFKVDIRTVYISPALNYEHGRIARLVKPGEFVVNMFAGAGLFSIIIAKLARPHKVVSIDINPNAYQLMVENIKLNKVEGVVEPLLGDAREVVRKCCIERADRVLMPLPELAIEYLPDAILALKKEGMVHVYYFISAGRRDEALMSAERIFVDKLKTLGVEWEFASGRVVRSVGPRYYQVVLDIRIKKRD